MIVKSTARKPVYCRECKGHDTWVRNEQGDVKTKSGKVFMMSWKCKVCGHTTIMSNPEFVSLKPLVTKGTGV